MQEVPREEFKGKEVLVGPILRISCSEVVEFLRPVKACSNAFDFVYHTTFDLYTLQSRVRLNTLYSAHCTPFDKSNRV